MKKVNHILQVSTPFVLLCVILLSCDNLKRGGTMLKESGEVVGKQYTPDTRETVFGTGISSDGKAIFTTHSIGEDEKYIVVFKCEHGVIFTISNKELYGKLHERDSVVIDYYELINNKGEVKDFDFIDANSLQK